MIRVSKHYIHHIDYVLGVHQKLVQYLTKNYGMPFNRTEKKLFRKVLISKARGAEVSSTLREAQDNDLVFKFNPEAHPLLNPKSQTLEDLFPEFNFLPKSEN